MLRTKFFVAALFLLPTLACDDPASIQDDEESNEVVRIEDPAAEDVLPPSGQREIAAKVNPTAAKKNCCFKCYQAGPWYEIKLNDGCNQYALGWCAGKHHAGVREAEWSNKCPLW